MYMNERLFYKNKYKKCMDDSNRPYIEINMDKKSIMGLADTGCDPGLLLSKDEAQKFEMGIKINEEPIRLTVADGHQLNADVYFKKIKIGDIEKEYVFSSSISL